MAKKQRTSKRHLRRVRFIVILSMLAVIGFLIIVGLKAPMFNVTEVEVEGNHYYSDGEIVAMADCSE